MKTLNKDRLIAQTQIIVNRWVRMRDKELFNGVCISCNKSAGEGHAGHYLRADKQSGTRGYCLDISNIHLQCIYCNICLHGNLENYRIGLKNRYGSRAVELLEIKKRTVKRLEIQEIQEIKENFTNLLKIQQWIYI